MNIVKERIRRRRLLQTDSVGGVLGAGLAVGRVRLQLLDLVDEGLVEEGLAVVGHARAPDGVVGGYLGRVDVADDVQVGARPE